MTKTSVLFLCIHNSARSQMAEALLKKLDGQWFEVESAGLEAGKINPLAVQVMKEVGADISGNTTKKVWDFIKGNRRFEYVITMCDEAAEKCPIFPGFSKRLHWSFPDPASFSGTPEEKLEQTRRVRNAIELKIREWIQILDNGWKGV